MRSTVVLASVVCLGWATACGGSDASAVDAAAGVDSGDPVDAEPTAPDAATESRIDRVLALMTDGTASAAQLDAELTRDAREASWPLHEGDRWLFARRWTDAPGDAAVTGDWVGFAAGAVPAQPAVIGDFVYVLVDESAGDVRPAGLYKWWSAAGGYHAPPESTVYGYDEFGAYGEVQPPDQAHLQRFPAFAGALTSRSIRVRVPAFGAAARVLLMHDGQNVFDPGAAYGGWQADGTLGAGGYDDVLAVAIDNTGARFDEYTQVPDDIGGGNVVGGAADLYWDLVDDDVLPFIRARFGVAAATDDVAIVGSSLGGLVTLYGAMTAPARARCSIGMSSTLGWGSFGPDTDASLIETWTTTAPASVVVTMGGGEGLGCADGDGDGVEDDIDMGDNYCESMQFAGVLEGLGYAEGTDLAVLLAPGAQHNEQAWAAMLPRALAACVDLGWTN